MAIKVPLFRPIDDGLREIFMRAIERVLDSHWYVLGKEVTEFEKAFADYCGVQHCVCVANGTDALEIALRVLGVVAGDRVVLVANAGFYGSTVLHLIGALPVYAEVDRASMTMSTDKLASILATKPKALIVTHLYGQLADIETIVQMATEYDVPVIEDCAQAHGSSRNGKRAGGFGTLGCFSFYPTKNLGALGDGGAVVTDDKTRANLLRQLRQYGWVSKYIVGQPGGRNSRLDEMQAAILHEKLHHIDDWNTERRSLARRYNDAFSDLPVVCPASTEEDFVAHLYVLRVLNHKRDSFREWMAERGIATDVHYPLPDHLQSAYPCSQSAGSLPITEELCQSVVTLPCFPGITEKEVEYVINSVRAFFMRLEI